MRTNAPLDEARGEARSGHHALAARLFAEAAAKHPELAAHALGRAAVEALAAGDPASPLLRDQAILALERESGEPLRLRTGGAHGEVVWSSDGQWVGTFDADGLDVLDAATLTPAFRIEGARAAALTAARAAIRDDTGSGSERSVLRVIDLERGTSRALAHPVDRLCTPAISRDGSLVAVATPRGAVLLFRYKDPKGGVDGEAGSVDLAREDSETPSKLVFSPDGRTLFAVLAGAIAAWNTETGAPIPVARRAHGKYFCVTPSGEGRMVAYTHEDESEASAVVLRDVITGAKVVEIALPPFVAQGERFLSKSVGLGAVSADCRRIGREAVLHHDVVNLETGARTLLDSRSAGKISLAPGVPFAALGHEGVELWDERDGTLRRRIGPGKSTLTAVERSPHAPSRVVLRAPGGLVMSWDAATGERRTLVPDAPNGVVDSITRDGRRRVYASRNELVVVDADTGADLARLESEGAEIRDVALEGDTLTALTGFVGIAAWDVPSGKLSRHGELLERNPYHAATPLTPSGAHYVRHTGSNALELRDSKTNALAKKLSLSPAEAEGNPEIRDGVLMLVSRSGTRLWDAETGEPLGRVPTDDPIAVTPDRARAAYRVGEELYVVELPSGKPIARLPAPKNGRVNAWLSPTLLGVLAGRYDDRTLALVRVTDGRVLAELHATGPGASGYARVHGQVTFFGPEAREQASCVAGRFAFPVALCEARFVSPGALEAALGEASSP